MSDKNSIKSKRPIPKPPRGFRDYMMDEAIFRNDIIRKISSIYELYGFDFLETPAVENVDALGEFLPDDDRPNNGIFSWIDNDTWLALRYDHTAPLARFYAQNKAILPNPYRRYSFGPVWRNEKPGPDRFRQFYQIDADTVGSSQVSSDAEMCMMLCEALENIGINFSEYKFRINNRKILSGVIESAGITSDKGDTVDDELFLKICRTVDKMDRLGIIGIKSLLGAGREDESGDFTPGLNLSSTQIDFFEAFLSKKDTWEDFFGEMRKILKGSFIGNEGLDELERMFSIFVASGYSDSIFSLDPTVVRGLGYYTGPVYEVELNRRLIDRNGKEYTFGSISGGGRYDGLVKRFTGQSIPAVGISIGLDRLIAALNIEKRIDNSADGPIIVTVMDKERYKDYHEIVNILRNNGLRSEIFMGNPKDLGRQLKYADQRKSPFAIIQGSIEAERGTVQVKDLKLGSKFSETIDSNERWKEHPSQFEVKLKDLVSKLKERLEE